jgi:hypothetical protein
MAMPFGDSFEKPAGTIEGDETVRAAAKCMKLDGAARTDAESNAPSAARDTHSVRWPGRACRRLGSMARAVGLACLVAGLAACAERTDRTAAVSTGEGGPGRILYLTYCQGCHGLGGRGDGPAAASLRTPPPDLTRLWQRYGTPLDRERRSPAALAAC